MRPFKLLIVLLEVECLPFVRFIRLELEDRAIIVHFLCLMMLVLPPGYQLGTLILVICRGGEVSSRFECTQVRVYLIKAY